MNCREFIIEFEDRAGVSEAAKLHLTICGDCRKTSERQTQIWLLIDELKPIAAPSNFDFRVKARIAEAKPSDFQSPRFLPILRYVLPLSVAVLLFGIFIFNSSYFPGSQSTSPIARNADAIVPVPETLPAKLSPPDQLAVVSPNVNQQTAEPLFANTDSTAEISSKTVKRTANKRSGKFETATVSSNRQAEFLRKSAQNPLEITSRDIASTDTVVRTPKGIKLNANADTAPNIEGSKPADDESVLKFFGIETNSENGKRTVVTVNKNSAAEYSGVKIGDVVEKVKDNAVMILRGAEKLEIILQNKTDQKP